MTLPDVTEVCEKSTVLSVNQLTLSTSQKTIFGELRFTVHAGELLAVMGPSGIGKSMLAKAIAGFLPEPVHAEGRIQIAGSEVSQLSLLQRRADQRPAFIFQDALQALNPLVSVESHLGLALEATRTRLSEAQRLEVTLLLSRLGFTTPESVLPLLPGQLSGGQRQRICIAMALLGHAHVLIADEPTSALDPVTGTEILSLIRENVHHRDLAGVLITHDLPSALACDKLLVIDDGKMVAYDTPDSVLRRNAHPFCQQLARLAA